MQVPQRLRIFCNRTLNLRSIRAIGYDMDYTLIHYQVQEWERRAYYHLKNHFVSLGWPVAHLEFDPEMVCRGLIVDTEHGNLVKANRFGFVKHAVHGTQTLEFSEQRRIYSRTMVELSDSRWVFLNTLFSLSEGCMYSQLVDLLDDKKLPETLGYADLYKKVRFGIDFAHMEGKLKADILANPERFVELDPEVPLTLLDQRNAGKKLLLITNSEWSYAVPMMSYAFDRFLPKGMTWRDLFDVVILGARKPDFFSSDYPFYEVVTEEGLLKPSMGGLKPKTVYLGGSARQVEKHLGFSGDEILYIGDHMFGDVRATKAVLRWRTALILRELEQEIGAIEAFLSKEAELAKLMDKKEELERQGFQARLYLQRIEKGYGPKPPAAKEDFLAQLSEIRGKTEELDKKIGPLAVAAAELNNERWGLLMRAGNDKSLLAFQIERYADIYTSRVSNFLYGTPFVYLRSPRGSLPHDPGFVSEQV